MNLNFLSAIVDYAENRFDGKALHYKPSGSQQWNSLSWQEFAKFTRKTSAALLQLGVKRADNVGIFSQNMPEWTIVDLGIMCSNAVSVPIYATNTSSHARYIIDEAEIQFLFVGEEEQYKKALEIYSQDDCPLEMIIVFDRNVKIDTAGAIYFEWIDEWFKRNWLVMDFEQTHHNSKLWHNVENKKRGEAMIDSKDNGSSREPAFLPPEVRLSHKCCCHGDGYHG